MKLISFSTGVLLAFVSLQISAQQFRVVNAWLHTADSGMVTGVFMTIENLSNQPDTIISALCDCARYTEIHSTVRNADGTVGMRPINMLVIPGRQKLHLKPGSYHIMLYHVHRPLRKGDLCILRIQTTRGRIIPVSARVQ